MAGLVEELGRHGRIGIDTMVFIYHFEAQPPLSELATSSLNAMNSGIFHGVTSTITLAELLVQPIQHGRLDIARQYELALSRFGNFWMTAVDTQLAVRAAELRAQHGLHVADALQIASALEQSATAFLTNDARLRQVRELEVLMLDDFVEREDHPHP